MNILGVMIAQLYTPEQVVDALGGPRELAATLGLTRSTPVYNWLYRGRFPSHRYTTMIGVLHRRGMTAPASLWRMTESAA